MENTDTIKKGAGMMKEGLEKEAYELGGKVKEEINKGEKCAKESIHALEETVKSYPLMALGVSFLFGLVTSKIFGNK